MRITIDHDRCTGHGRCYALVGDLVVDDEAGYGQVRGDGTVPPDRVAEARRCAQACPERAITLES